jgi:hypothetical protein
VFIVLGLAGWGLARQMDHLADDLPTYRVNILAKIADVRGVGKGGSVEKLQETMHVSRSWSHGRTGKANGGGRFDLDRGSNGVKGQRSGFATGQYRYQRPNPLSEPSDSPNGRATRPRKFFRKMAGPTRLELATSGVTGQRSNQLNYDPARAKSITLNCVDTCNSNSRTSSVGKPLVHAGPGGRVFDSKSRVQTHRCTSHMNGRYRTRTCDSRRVRPVLYQLS